MSSGLRWLLAVLACFAIASGSALAQAWPNRPIALVVPYSPGGGSDFVGRLLAEHLGESLGQSVIVENMPGAGATIGYGSVAKAPPDGYRLLITDSGQTIFPALYPMLTFDPMANLEPVSLLIEVPVAVTIGSKIKATTVADFVRLAKASPGKLNFGSGGTGTANHIAGEMFKKLTGTDIVHVPYKGAGPMMAALLGGQVDVIFATMTTAGLASHHNSGAIRVLAVSGSKRSASLPDVPSAAEVGLPTYTYTIWWGLSVPKGTPAAIVSRLGEEVQKFLAKPATQKKMAEFGATVLGTSQADAQGRIARETKEISTFASQLGIKP